MDGCCYSKCHGVILISGCKLSLVYCVPNSILCLKQKSAMLNGMLTVSDLQKRNLCRKACLREVYEADMFRVVRCIYNVACDFSLVNRCCTLQS